MLTPPTNLLLPYDQDLAYQALEKLWDLRPGGSDSKSSASTTLRSLCASVKMEAPKDIHAEFNALGHRLGNDFQLYGRPAHDIVTGLQDITVQVNYEPGHEIREAIPGGPSIISQVVMQNIIERKM